MFNWLRATAGNIEGACEAFKEYKGKESDLQFSFQPPQPMEQDVGYTDGWSHVIDHDAMGIMPEFDFHHSSVINIDRYESRLDISEIDKP